MGEKFKSLFGAIGYILIAVAIQIIVAGMVGLWVAIFNVDEEMIEGSINSMYIVTCIINNWFYIIGIAALINVFVIWLIFKKRGKLFYNELYLRGLSIGDVMFAVGFGISIWCINAAITAIIIQQGIFGNPLLLLGSAARAFEGKNIFFVIAIVVVIIPIAEEILFRGAIYQSLNKRWPIWFTIGMQAVLFSLFSFHLVQGRYTLLLGLLLGYVVYHTQSLGIAIIVNMVNNILIVIAESRPPVLLGPVFGVILLIIGVLGMWFLIAYMINNTVVEEDLQA